MYSDKKKYTLLNVYYTIFHYPSLMQNVSMSYEACMIHKLSGIHTFSEKVQRLYIAQSEVKLSGQLAA